MLGYNYSIMSGYNNFTETLSIALLVKKDGQMRMVTMVRSIPLLWQLCLRPRISYQFLGLFWGCLTVTIVSKPPWILGTHAYSHNYIAVLRILLVTQCSPSPLIMFLLSGGGGGLAKKKVCFCFVYF